MKKTLFLICLIVICFFSPNSVFGQWIQTSGPHGASVHCFESMGEDLFIGTDGGVYLSMDNGDSWKLVDDGMWNPTVLSLATLGSELFAATHGGGVFRSTNKGTTWSPANNGLGGSTISLAVIGSFLFAGEFSTSSGVFRSDNLGSSWTRVGTITDQIGTLAVIDTILFAQTKQTGVYRSTDYGTSWIPVNTGLPIDTTICLLAPFDTILYAGTSIGLYRSTDYGDNWTEVDVVTNDMVFTSASIGTTLFVGTGNGGIYSTDDGTNWKTVTTSLYHTCLYARGSDLFAGTSRGVYRSEDFGETWTEGFTGLISTSVRAMVSRDDDLYATTISGTFRSNDGGDSWTYLGPGGHSIAINGPHIYIGSSGHVVCSTDNGVNWEWVPVAPGLFVRAVALHGTDLFAGMDGEGAGVYRITYNAPGWWTITKTTLRDIAIRSLLVKDANIFAGTDNGLFLSENNGTSWSQINNGLPDSPVMALAAGDTFIFAGTRNAGIFRSQDGGASWTPVNTGLTWMEVISFAVSEDTVFAGTWRGGVFLSVNNGNTWRPVNSGLTDYGSDASTVVHALAIQDPYIYAGTRGAGAWRRPLSEMNIAVTVTSPNGGEQWKAGSTEFVSWTSFNIQNVKIEYSTNGGSNWDPIVNTTAAVPAGYPWLIPDIASENCLVRISDILDDYINDVSDNLFTIYQPLLILTSPNGGENWKAGSTDTIKWNSEYVENIKIEYSVNGGMEWHSIVNTIASSPSAYLWTIPDTLSTNCLVRVSDVLDAKINDVSDSLFTIFRPSLLLLEPDGKESWKAGSTQTIEWISDHVDSIKIEYSINGGTDWNTIINTLAASTSTYLWMLPDTQSTSCLVKISDVLDIGIKDVSDALFTIYRPSLVLTSPNGSEKWKSGTIDTIKWASNYILNIKIDYSADRGKNWSPIVDAIPAVDSAYRWTIPDTVSTICLVKISDVSDSNIYDVSDTCFAIESVPVSISFTENGFPREYRLLQNFPNPFNPETQIKFALPKPESVKIEVYNLLGRKIRTLINKPMPAGYHDVGFNGQDLASGVYLYRMEAGTYCAVRKMILLK